MELNKTKGLHNYFLHVRMSDKSTKRWDASAITDMLKEVELESNGEIAKVYVCGPPPMNELFDKELLEHISADKIEIS
jgi:NAD(P)H-flavin reductase